MVGRVEVRWAARFLVSAAHEAAEVNALLDQCVSLTYSRAGIAELKALCGVLSIMAREQMSITELWRQKLFHG